MDKVKTRWTRGMPSRLKSVRTVYFAKELMKKNEIQNNQHSIVLYQNEDSNVCVNVYYRNSCIFAA